ncbi:MAG: hypothetical protein IT176_00930 [Acidobacteria bacterium]|nr:hypothetical protein [Acidobacteriota bacterium]
MMLRAVAILGLACAIAPGARAQEPPPRLPPFVIDLHGTFARLPAADAELRASRSLNPGELPSRALGGDAALQVFPVRYRGVTFGIGGHVVYSRGRQAAPAERQSPFLRPVTERFVTGGAQLSFNFGTGDGWSYLSGGIGTSVWQIVPDGGEALPADEERLETFNYGGGARWFIKRHLAFSVDVRFHAIDAGTPTPERFGSPRTTLMVVGAGVSLK